MRFLLYIYIYLMQNMTENVHMYIIWCEYILCQNTWNKNACKFCLCCISAKQSHNYYRLSVWGSTLKLVWPPRAMCMLNSWSWKLRQVLLYSTVTISARHLSLSRYIPGRIFHLPFKHIVLSRICSGCDPTILLAFVTTQHLVWLCNYIMLLSNISVVSG